MLPFVHTLHTPAHPAGAGVLFSRLWPVIRAAAGGHDNPVNTQTEAVLLVFIISLAVCAIGLGAGMFWLMQRKKEIDEQVAELTVREERFRTLYEEAPLSYQALDANGRIIDVNPAWCECMGYTRDEVIGRSMEDFLAPASRRRFQQTFACFQADGVMHGVEYQLVRKNGLVITVSFEGRVVRDADGIFRQTHCIFHDISARHSAQEALRHSEEKFSKAFHISPDSININRLKDGLYIDINEGFCKMTGYARDEVIGRSSLDINIWVEPDRRARLVAALLSTGEVSDFEAAFRMKDGRIRTGLMSARTMKINGEMCILSITRDITERKQAELEIRRQVERLAALHAVDVAITSGSNLQETLAVLLKNVTDHLQVDGAAVLLYQPGAQTLTFGHSYGLEPPCRCLPITPQEFDIPWQVIETRAPVRICPDGGSPRSRCAAQLGEESYHFYYAVPLTTKSGPTGVLEVFRKETFTPDDDWLQFLEALASQAAIAIENTRLFQELQQANQEITQAYDETIQGLVRALELRDGDTEGHSQRVTDMSVRLARSMGLDEEALVHLRRGALLHDLGKMGVPDSILRKPGELTAEETEIMQQHPRLAYTFLSGIDFLREALDIPLYHHEHWDGSGYPDGRKGEEIPLAARIFAVVDVWDALRSNRPYRRQWTPQVVRAHLLAMSGQQFDPAVVEQFIALLDQHPAFEEDI